MAQHVVDLRAQRSRTFAERLRRIDVVLIASTLVVAAAGVVIVYSATRDQLAAAGYSPHYYLERQAMFVLVGALVMGAIAWIDLQRIEDWAALLYVGLLVALVAVKLPGIGSSQLGSQRWFQLGPVQVQPSAFAAPILVIVVAAYLGRSAERRGEVLTLRRLGVALGLVALPLALVVVQPDLGSGIVIGVSLIAVLVVAGTRFSHIALLFLLAALGIFAIIHLHLLHQYQLNRLTSFLHQAKQYNLVQSKDTIGSGGIFGTGLFKGPQTNYAYVPEQQTDFIFTAVGEQLGFIGAAGLLSGSPPGSTPGRRLSAPATRLSSPSTPSVAVVSAASASASVTPSSSRSRRRTSSSRSSARSSASSAPRRWSSPSSSSSVPASARPLPPAATLPA